MKISEVTIDNRHGIGSTPYNQEVNYRGLRVLMKPSVFLDLAAFLHIDDRNEYVEKAIADGVAIGAPFLIIKIPVAWFDSKDYSEPAQVVSHEGRNRMQAVWDVEGNKPIETHLFFRDDIRNRDLTPEIIEALNQGMYLERTRALKRGPLFAYSKNELTEIIKLRRVNPKPAQDFIDNLRNTSLFKTIDGRDIVIYREPGEIALAQLSPSIKEEGMVHIISLIAEPRRQGVGGRALEDLKDLAAKDGIGLELFVWENGPVPESSLIRFYTKHGFKFKNGMMIWKPPKKVNETLKRVKGKWALVSKSNPKKVLQYYHGSGHPSKEWVSKVERRVHSFSEGVGRITPQNVTQDVGLNQTSIEAAKFGNKVDRDGYPAQLMRKKKLREAKELGDCFKAAGKNILHGEIPGLVLVHAMVTGQGGIEGVRHAHAWNEIGDVVLDNSNGRNIVMRKEQYYELGKVNEDDPSQYRKYDRTAALKWMVKTKNYGPWELDES